MNQFGLYYGGNQGTFGDVLNQPVAPPITGAQFLKFAAFAFIGIWIFGQFTKTLK